MGLSYCTGTESGIVISNYIKTILTIIMHTESPSVKDSLSMTTIFKA